MNANLRGSVSTSTTTYLHPTSSSSDKAVKAGQPVTGSIQRLHRPNSKYEVTSGVMSRLPRGLTENRRGNR